VKVRGAWVLDRIASLLQKGTCAVNLRLVRTGGIQILMHNQTNQRKRRCQSGGLHEVVLNIGRMIVLVKVAYLLYFQSTGEFDLSVNLQAILAVRVSAGTISTKQGLNRWMYCFAALQARSDFVNW
jgi:hypothetical protein